MQRLIAVTLFLISVSATAGVVLPVGAANHVLIPAAGSLSGANGTFFRSDISIVNLASHDQAVSLQWIPQAGAGASVTNTIEIRALSGIRSPDFVHDYLNQSGLGAIIVKAVANGALDTSAALYVSSRIWTPQPGTTGTTSQSLDVIPMNAINTPIAALFSMGSVTNPENFRLNVGIVNVDPVNPQTFSISFPSILLPPPVAPLIVTLPPMTMQLVPLGSGAPPPQITIQNATPAASRSNLWIAFGSTIDNTTGDAWSELAVPGTVP